MGEGGDDNELTIGEMCGLWVSPVLLERAIQNLVQRGLIIEVKRENAAGAKEAN